MKPLSVVFGASLATITYTGAIADFACNGALKSSQVAGFVTMFDPDFSPKLINISSISSSPNMVKRVTQQEYTALAVNRPLIAASTQLNATNADHLKAWLNENASAGIPSWFTTTLGLFIPNAWINITADVAVQLVNASGDAGRLQLANLAGNVSAGGYVGVAHVISKDKNGNDKYVWHHIYSFNLNDKSMTAILYSCSADVVKQ